MHKERLDCMTFLCMIELRDKTVAHPSFDKANGHLCQERFLDLDRNLATKVN